MSSNSSGALAKAAGGGKAESDGQRTAAPASNGAAPQAQPQAQAQPQPQAQAKPQAQAHTTPAGVGVDAPPAQAPAQALPLPQAQAAATDANDKEKDKDETPDEELYQNVQPLGGKAALCLVQVPASEQRQRHRATGVGQRMKDAMSRRRGAGFGRPSDERRRSKSDERAPRLKSKSDERTASKSNEKAHGGRAAKRPHHKHQRQQRHSGARRSGSKEATGDVSASSCDTASEVTRPAGSDTLSELAQATLPPAYRTQSIQRRGHSGAAEPPQPQPQPEAEAATGARPPRRSRHTGDRRGNKKRRHTRRLGIKRPFLFWRYAKLGGRGAGSKEAKRSRRHERRHKGKADGHKRRSRKTQ